MGYFIGEDGGYYEGDRISPDDTETARRPSAEHVLVDGVWQQPLEPVIARKKAAVTERYQQALAAGLPYEGKTLQIRDEDQGNLSTMGSEARWAKEASLPWPASFAWRMADDTFLPLETPEKCIALATAAKTEVIRLRMVKWSHTDAIAGLLDVASVEAYDIEAGW